MEEKKTASQDEKDVIIRKLWVMNESIMSTVSELDIDTLLGKVAFSAKNLIKGEMGFVFLKKSGEHSQQIVFFPDTGMKIIESDDWTEYIHNVVEEAGVIREGPELDKNLYISLPDGQSKKVTSILASPLIAGDQTLGGLFIMNKPANASFSGGEEDLCLTFCMHIGLAIDNAIAHSKNYQRTVTDALTGVFNRKYFKEFLENEIRRSKRYEHKVALLMINIDNFESINEIYGRLSGDTMLRGIARLFSKSIRDTDVLCRYSGDEFAIALVEDKEGISGTPVPVRILDNVSRHEFATGEAQESIRITVSIGSASFPEDGQTADELCQNAVKSLQKAKEEKEMSQEN